MCYITLEVWYARCEGEGWTLAPDAMAMDVPYQEEVIYQHWFWLKMHLRELQRASRRLIDGELIDPCLDYTVTKRDLCRLPPQGGSSQAIRKWSLAFRLYDRMSRILSKPLPLLLQD